MDFISSRMPPKRLSAEAALHMILLGEVSDSSNAESDAIDEETDDVDNLIPPHPRDDDDEVSDNDSEVSQEADLLIDKDGQRWSLEPPATRGRRDASNVFHRRPGPKPSACKDSVLQTWQLFFTDQLLRKILHYSQQKANELGIDTALTLVQLKAFIGILYFRGLNNDNKVPVDELWKEESHAFYRASMSRSLFKTWLRVIRFDESTGRRERAGSDTFTAFREVWTDFNDSLRKHYEPSAYLVVDEQLVTSRCRSPHRTYNPFKPGKYGEMYRWCVDGERRYVYKGNPLIKKPEDPVAAAAHKEANKVRNLVLDLLEPYLGTGRNVTGDRYFSSCELTEELLTEHQTTYLGTLMSNKRKIPAILHEKLRLHESKFVFGGQNRKISMCAYQARQKKKIHMISSLHHDKSITDDAQNLKPKIILDYNSTKAGVDVVDQMCRRYSTNSATRRWPLRHFQNILDIGALNTETIYNECHPGWSGQREKHGRRIFLKTLSRELAEEHMLLRLRASPTLQVSVRRAIQAFVGTQQESASQSDLERGETARCKICRNSGKMRRACNVTKNRCQICEEPVCGRHSHVVGVICDDCQ